ncbi:hypothetical protein CAPTEDRAFT_228866 [Capitella teleta]|uniref:Uncharacterized protein n=1 Tax=Capitella teleta TaxID=283909 RepID=R7TB25_CAPTE|nr:hypothetical protein CAPTEDRAFT_228866 [Capitella teleta]|eukprot:ELT88199.1 hypothetical protein CAPTEDRAFT_228866 [Capitella teleta]
MNSLSPREHLLKRPRFPVVQDNSVVSVSSLKQPPTAPGLDILADAVQQKGDALHLGDMCPKQEVVPAKVMSPVNQIPSSPAQYVIPNHRNPNQKIVLTVHGSDVEIGHQQSTDSPIMESIQTMPVKNGASTVIDNVDIETEMLDFMRRYASEVSRNNGRKPQTPVRDLRHMIPLLIMHLYGVKAEQSHRKSKVKGMWWTTPKDWPSGVPFCDPNNSKLPTPDGSLSKPKKETLILMFNFLMGKYNQKIVDSPSSSQEDLNMAKTILHAFTIKPSHDSASDNLNLLASVVTGSAHEESKSTLLGRRPSSEPSEQIEPKCLKVDNPPQPVLLSPPIAQALSSGSVTQVSVVGPPSHLLKPKAACLSPPLPNTSCTSGGKIQAPKNLSRIAEVPKENGWDLRRQSEAEAPPKMSVEVQDDEEEVFDWDPVADICRLNEQKFRYIVAKKIVPQRDLGYLHLANEMLVKMRQISMDREEEKVKFLEKAHDFSLTLDLCHMLGHMPEKHRVKWSDTQALMYMEIIGKANSCGNG